MYVIDRFGKRFISRMPLGQSSGKPHDKSIDDIPSLKNFAPASRGSVVKELPSSSSDM
jgi:hypothetical protein